MAVTFKVSNVKRSTCRLSFLPEGTSPSFLGQGVEAWGSSAGRFDSADNGFLSAAQIAYDQHLPLALSPDAVWLCIAKGFAQHVKQNAERLRGKFVRHGERAEIVVERHDFVKGSRSNPWPEAFGQFSEAIAAHIGRQRDLVVCDFSTTGPCERAASEIVLMDAMQHYFAYRLHTLCGIPEITLEGTAEDWRQIRRRAAALDEYELSWWTGALLPVLDHFVLAASGSAPDVAFWEAFFKVNDSSGGPYVTGWINVLFPYLVRESEDVTIERNGWLTDWPRGMSAPFGGGLVPEQAPSGLSVVPFTWSYLNQAYSMEFLGGFAGVAQDADTLAVKPAIGWGVRDAGHHGGSRP